MKLIPLDPTLHGGLHITRQRKFPFSWVEVMPQEIPDLADNYPLYLMKHPETGQFICVAVLGFEDGENLLQNHMDAGETLPLKIHSWPFEMIPGQEHFQLGFIQGDPNISAKPDLSSEPNTSKDRLVPLFEQINASDILDSITHALCQIQGAAPVCRQFMQTLVQAKLIEPAKLEIHFNQQEPWRFNGLYVLCQPGIEGLNDTQQQKLQDSGILHCLQLIHRSQQNIKSLIQLKSQLLSSELSCSSP